MDFDLTKEINSALEAIASGEGCTVEDILSETELLGEELSLVDDIFDTICDKWDFPTTGKDADEFYQIVKNEVFGSFGF